MMDMAPNIDAFASEDVVVSRYGASTLGSDGLWTDPTATTVAVRALFVPITGRQLEQLPEGLRTRHPLCMFAKSEVRTFNETTKARADRFTRGGKTYEVHNVEDWSAVANYWKAVVAEVESA